MNFEDVKALGGLTEAAFLAAQAKLAKLSRQECALRDKLRGLQNDRNALARTERPADDAALAGGADVRWFQWIATRQTRLNAELAQVLALKAHQLELVRKAHGRQEALSKLALTLRAEQTLCAARKKDFES